MPITELDYQTMQAYTKDHQCAECGCGLAVAWIKGKYALRCGNNIQHSRIKKIERIPEYLKKELEKEMTTQLMTTDKKKMLARIESAKFPQELKPLEKQLLAQTAIDYGLDPVMGELTIYQGKPFISIDGRLRKAHETGLFEGIESRPATEEERKARGTATENKLWRSEVFKKGCTHGFVGWGEVRASEMKGNAFLPTVSWPDRMAEKRSQVMALRLAFYLPLPSFEEIDQSPTVDKPFVDSTAKEIKPPKDDQPPLLDSDFR